MSSRRRLGALGSGEWGRVCVSRMVVEVLMSLDLPYFIFRNLLHFTINQPAASPAHPLPLHLVLLRPPPPAPAHTPAQGRPPSLDLVRMGRVPARLATRAATAPGGAGVDMWQRLHKLGRGGRRAGHGAP